MPSHRFNPWAHRQPEPSARNCGPSASTILLPSGKTWTRGRRSHHPRPPCLITPSPAPAKHPIRSTWFAVTAKIVRHSSCLLCVAAQRSPKTHGCTGQLTTAYFARMGDPAGGNIHCCPSKKRTSSQQLGSVADKSSSEKPHGHRAHPDIWGLGAFHDELHNTIVGTGRTTALPSFSIEFAEV